MSLFASRSVGLRVGRGAGAALLAAPVLLRGCPMCWVIGLIEAISAATLKGRDR